MGVQLVHRLLALVVFVTVLVYALGIWRQRSTTRPGGFALAVIAALLAQVFLGVTTLLLKVPVVLGVAHQGGALVLVGVLVFVVSTRLPLLFSTNTE